MRLQDYLDDHKDAKFRIAGGRFGKGVDFDKDGVVKTLSYACQAEVAETEPNKVNFILPNGRIEYSWSVEIV